MFRIPRKRLAVLSSTLTIVLALLLATAASAGGPVAHRVSAGGPDACIAFGFPHPGCDGNFSLVGTVYADGSMSGQYTDRFARGNGFHAVIDGNGFKQHPQLVAHLEVDRVEHLRAVEREPGDAVACLVEDRLRHRRRPVGSAIV